MTFEKFSEKLASHFLNGVSVSPALQTDADKDKLWEIYLASFPAGTNPIFRKRTEHDCTCCRRFIRELGGVVWYDSGYRLTTIYLSPELREHRKVFEALGAQMAVAETDNQLSGLGFCLTRRADVVVKVKGAAERIIRIKF